MLKKFSCLLIHFNKGYELKFSYLPDCNSITISSIDSGFFGISVGKPWPENDVEVPQEARVFGPHGR